MEERLTDNVDRTSSENCFIVVRHEKTGIKF